MKKIKNKLSLNKHVVTRLDNVKGGDDLFPTSASCYCTVHGSCLPTCASDISCKVSCECATDRYTTCHRVCDTR